MWSKSHWIWWHLQFPQLSTERKPNRVILEHSFFKMFNNSNLSNALASKRKLGLKSFVNILCLTNGAYLLPGPFKSFFFYFSIKFFFKLNILCLKIGAYLLPGPFLSIQIQFVWVSCFVWCLNWRHFTKLNLNILLVSQKA